LLVILEKVRGEYVGRGDNAGHPSPFRPSPYLARKMRVELTCPTFSMRTGNFWPTLHKCGLVGQPTFLKKIMIKFLMFNKLWKF